MKVAFDVDGTLLNYDRTPNFKVIRFFQQFESFGCEMYIWSGGGIGYAEQVMRNLGLKAKIMEKGSFQADIAVDDQRVALGKVNICVTEEIL